MNHIATAFTIAAACVISAWGGRSLFADEQISVESLRRERLKAAEEWWLSLAATLHGPSDYGEYFPPAKALKEAQLELAANKRERIKALEAYRDRMQELYDKINALFEVQAKGGEPERRAEARFYLLEAKIRIKEEEAKP
jgi:hypothetical protein